MATRLLRIITLLLLMSLSNIGCASEDYDKERRLMIEAIEETVAYTRAEIGKEELAPAVMQAMARVPRHEFVPPEIRSYAYWNRALPIGHDQTISQPYIVALMTDLAQINEESIVLEVGTGSGYQAAVLAEVAKHVYTIEIVAPLADRARDTLTRLGYTNITVRAGDGYHGWSEHAPFDAILVTAAPDQIPQPLIDQLRPGGRLVIPVGGLGYQSLQVLEKTEDGNIHILDVLPVAFVPLTRDE